MEEAINRALKHTTYKNRRDVVVKTLLRSLRRFFYYQLAKISGHAVHSESNCCGLPQEMTAANFEQCLAKLLDQLEECHGEKFSSKYRFKLGGFVATLTSRFGGYPFADSGGQEHES